MKNIYDLEGNYGEWTAEAYDTDSRVYRGGFYVIVSMGYFYPASNRDFDFLTVADDGYSSRAALYVAL